MTDTKDNPGAPRTDGRTLRANRRRAETRGRILDAACAAFAQDGYHRTSVDDIIQRVGIARGTFYLHFEGKRAVLDALLHQILMEISSAVRPIEIEASVPAQDQLRNNLERVWAVFTDNPQMAQLILGGLQGVDPEFDAQIATLEASVLALIVRSIEKGHQLGWLVPFDARIAACALVGAVKENLADELLRDGQRSSESTRVRELLALLLPGVALGPLSDRAGE